METRTYAIVALALASTACGAPPAMTTETAASSPAPAADASTVATVVDANTTVPTVAVVTPPPPAPPADLWPANGIIVCDVNTTRLSARYKVWDTAVGNPNADALATTRVISLTVVDRSYSTDYLAVEVDFSTTTTYDFRAPGADAGWAAEAHLGYITGSFTPDQLNSVGYATSERSYNATFDINRFALTLEVGGNAGPLSGAVFGSTDCHLQ